MNAGTLATLHRYPVKSMMGEELNAGFLTERGLFGDRSYALRDTDTGKIVSAKNPKKWPDMFRFRASYTSPPDLDSALPPVRVMLPGGDVAVTSSSDFAPAVSAALGRSVALLAAAPQSPQLEEYWPDRDAVTDEAMPPGTFFDLAILHVLTTGTLDRFRELNPCSRFEPRRFRANLIIDTGDRRGFVENEWIGKELAIGPEVRIQITEACPRCVMTTLPQGDLPKDPEILKTAAKYNDAHVGVYASVVKTGTVRIGDAVSLA